MPCAARPASRRASSPSELDTLTICHVDCDAFYATIEKRDDPSLADKPLIIGGGKRGVVPTSATSRAPSACARRCRCSRRRRLCPHATIVRPNMDKYATVSRAGARPDARHDAAGRADLDRRGVHGSCRHRRLHGMSAAKVPARFSARVEKEIGITVSIRLAANSSWPRSPPTPTSRGGFAVLGQPRRRRSWPTSR